MENLLDTLPGIRLSVDAVTRTLSHMWDVEPGDHGHPPSDFRASQMNLILHFGLNTTAAEAQQRFDTAILFAQRYPCRIVVLCPARPDASEDLLVAKLFSQCYIGANQRELCCCEALILGYSIDESSFLENQVSLWLESDLPVYHWFNRVPAARIEKFYMPFIQRCQRVLLDTAVEGDALQNIRWPDPDRVHDLANARTLPFRQQLGQFLSSIPIEVLLKETAKVIFSAESPYCAELMHLKQWHDSCWKQACREHKNIEVKADPSSSGCKDLESGQGMRLLWLDSAGKELLRGEFKPEQQQGRIHCQLNGHCRENVFHLEALKPEVALSEALFF